MSKKDKNEPDEQISLHNTNTSDQIKLKRKEYTKELLKLQTELCLLQNWIKLRSCTL